MSVQATVWPRGIHRVKTSGPLGVTWNAETRRVGGAVPATAMGRLVSAKVSTRWEDGFGGEDLCSFSIVPHPGFIGGMFRPGDHLRITMNGGTVGEAELSEVIPNGDGTVEFKARGYAYNLFEYDSIYYFDDGVTTVSYPTTQLLPSGYWTPVANTEYGWEFATNNLGMPINQVVGSLDYWNAPRGESRVAEAPVKLAPIITENAREAGNRWAVWGRSLVIAADPTTPRWSFDAPEGLVGTADTEYATHVAVWYVKEGPDTWSNLIAYSVGDIVEYDGRWWEALVGNTGVTPASGGTWKEISVNRKSSDYDLAWAIDTTEAINRFDTKTAVVDYRGLGKISPARANTIASSLLSQVKARWFITGSINLTPDSGFKSAEGGRAPIAFVRAGHGLTLTSLRTSQGNLFPEGAFHVIGRTDWQWQTDGSGQGTEQCTVTPMGAVPRSFSDILKGVPAQSSKAVA